MSEHSEGLGCVSYVERSHITLLLLFLLFFLRIVLLRPFAFESLFLLFYFLNLEPVLALKVCTLFDYRARIGVLWEAKSMLILDFLLLYSNGLQDSTRRWRYGILNESIGRIGDSGCGVHCSDIPFLGSRLCLQYFRHHFHHFQSYIFSLMSSLLFSSRCLHRYCYY